MASKTAKSPTKYATEELLRIPLTDIITDGPIANARSGVIEESAIQDENSGQLETFETFKASIARGQKTPATVRPSKTKKGKFELIVGYRRFAALKSLFDAGPNEEGTIPCPTIMCAVREGMSDFEARLENIGENIERVDLKSADTAWALADLKSRGILENKGYTDGELGDLLGKSQSYSQRLLTIMGGCTKEVAARWRAEVVTPTVSEMTTIATADKDKQDGMYNDYVGAKTKEEPNKKGPSAWFPKRKAELKLLGQVLKQLEGKEHRDGAGQFSAATIELLVQMGFMKLGKNSTDTHVEEMVGCLTDGYQDGWVAPKPKEKKESDKAA